MMPHFQTTRQGIVFNAYIQPRAAANEIAGIRQEALKIRLTAPPADGEANRACLKFLAKALGVAKSDLEIVSGASGRNKKILVRIADGSSRQQAVADIKKRIGKLADKKGS
ncbi:MAG: DUF167 domain-containing protein [Desulfobacterales bacterium]